MIPRISLVAYTDPSLHDRVFVSVPNERGRYVLTHPCVVTVTCDVCGAAVGEPCSTKKRGQITYYITDTHYSRRDLHYKRRRNGEL